MGLLRWLFFKIGFSFIFTGHSKRVTVLSHWSIHLYIFSVTHLSSAGYRVRLPVSRWDGVKAWSDAQSITRLTHRDRQHLRLRGQIRNSPHLHVIGIEHPKEGHAVTGSSCKRRTERLIRSVLWLFDCDTDRGCSIQYAGLSSAVNVGTGLSTMMSHICFHLLCTCCSIYYTRAHTAVLHIISIDVYGIWFSHNTVLIFFSKIIIFIQILLLYNSTQRRLLLVWKIITK